MVAAALAVEGLFGAAGLIPHEHKARIIEASVQWNYTTILNILLGVLSAMLLARFFKTGGVKDDPHDEPSGATAAFRGSVTTDRESVRLTEFPWRVNCAINVPHALRRYELKRAFSIPRQKCFRAGVVCGK